MSVNASAVLWYGVYGDLPESARIELDEPADNPYGEKIVDGVHIHVVWAYDNVLGAGATAAHSWWGDKTEVDLSKLDAVKAAADKFLDEYGVSGDRGWHLTANYS
jgi:hypothetical protein